MKRFGRYALIVVAAVLGLMVLLAIVPVEVRSPAIAPSPAADYATAIQRLDALATRNANLINPECQDRRWLNGAKATRAIVLVHGLTNCPKQYDLLGPLLASTGANVIAIRLPYHGYADRNTDAMKYLTNQNLAENVSEAIDAAHGLGGEVDVLGISGGGIATAWAAQFRPDVRRIVSVAPVFGPNVVPEPLTVPLMRLVLRLPNIQTPVAGAYSYAYAFDSSHAVAQTMLLGQSVAQAAGKPVVSGLAVLTNDGDDAVNNNDINSVVARWRSEGATVRAVVLPVSAGFQHDTIDPSSGHHPEVTVYPILLQLLELPPAASR